MGDYTPPGFVPGPDSCIMPTLVEQKSRLTAGSIFWRSRDTGVLATVKAEWFYWDEEVDQYVVTTNVDDITIEGDTSRPEIPENPPKIVVTFTDKASATWNFETPQYILTWEETTTPPLPAPPETEIIVEYFSATAGLRSQINYGEFVTLPTVDNETEYDVSQDPELIGYFSTSDTYFVDPRIDGIFVFAGAPADPSGIRTGPDYTLANLDSTERNNNTGTMEPLNGLSAYNYTTQSWDPYPII